MTATQTKLSKSEKAEVRANVDLAAQNGVHVFWFPEYRATLAIGPTFDHSRMGSASVAIAAPTETKFRKWVGADKVLGSHENCFSVPVVLPGDFWIYSLEEQKDVLEEIASNLAFAVSGT